MREVRLWLDHCDKHHTDHCHFSPRSEEIFVHRPRWLIDVTRRCLVPAESGHRYVALSYVWGEGVPFKTVRKNLDHLLQEGSLELNEAPIRPEVDTSAGATVHEKSTDIATLPRTVRDVIIGTRLIGEKFLWVDSLCIVQDDDEDKQEHLSHMGSIYANAYVTIVAAGGTAFAGLSGIEHVTRPMDRAVAVPPYLRNEWSLHSKIMEHHRAIQKSPWNHRAWTFQEQIFSRRLLIFGAADVSWECHCAVWFEGMQPVEGKCQKNDDIIAQGFAFAIPPNMDDYARHVAQYNRRALTYPEDALDAFGGVLTTLATAFTGGFIYGLPVMFFDAALLWYNEAPLERRRPRRQDSASRMPPTWSWAAWSGGISYSDHKSCESVQSLVEWQYRADANESLRTIPTTKISSDIQAEMARLAINPSAKANGGSEDSEKTAQGSSNSVSSNGHLLFTRTRRSFFTAIEFYGDVQILLAGKSGDRVGMLTSLQKLETGIKPGDTRYELVALSEISANGDIAVNVLWIKWIDGVAYREGVGRILKAAWDEQGPELVDLVLG